MQRINFSVLCLLVVILTFQKSSASCLSGNCINGKGTYLFRDGSTYSGTFYMAKPNGKGTMYLRDGSIYNGNWLKGEKYGIGKLTFKGGGEYAGNFDSDMVSGEGRMIYRNGDVYSGNWVNGKPSGKGKYTFSDGDIYIGEFIDGEFNGDGRLTRIDGSYYHGKWIRSKKHGAGITYSHGKKISQYYEMNKLISEKVHAENMPTDNQILTSSANLMLSTQPLKDCTNQYCDHEKGIFVYGDGSRYKGDFIQGEGHGFGICTYANGDRYEGFWKNHAPHGKGSLFFANGSTYSAIWDNGVPIKKLDKESTEQLVSNIKVKTNTQKSESGNTEIFALVVGVATYNHMQSLKYTDDDAYQLYAFLKSPEGGAIPDNNIKILIDDAATNKAINLEIRQISERADDNDVIMLYMSGHGLEGAFVPSDFDGYKNQMAYGEILKILNDSRAKHKLFITDACHSGSMLASARTPLNVSLENFYSAYNTLNGGTAIMMSSKSEEVSLEYGGLRQGIFSHFLIKGLKGNADKNSDNLISVTELYDYVSTNVKNYTSNAQNPVIMGDYDKNMPIGLVR